MARKFARLKLTLLRNSLRGRGQRVWAFAGGAFLAAVLALLAFVAFASPPRTADARFTSIVLGCCILWLAWVVVPLIAFGSDETLDPARLALLPLRRRQLMTGLLAASAVGVVPAACLLGLAGALVGYGRSPLRVVVVGGAVVSVVALCISTSRAVTTTLSRALRSRRWRDVTAVVVSLFGLVVGWGRFVIGDLVEGTALASGTLPFDVARVVQWSPPGLAGRAIAEARDGELASAVVALALVVGWCGAALAWWGHSLERVTTTAESLSPAPGRGRRDLFPAVLRFMPRNRVGAVAAKELRYLWRDPRARGQAIGTVPVAVGLPFFFAASSGGSPRTVLLATGTAAFVGLANLNLYGFDGSALWMNIVAGHEPGRDLAGKGVAAAVVSLGISTVTAVGLAAVTSGWGYVPLAVCLSAGVVGVMLGIGSVFSVRSPLPVPESRGNLFASGAPGRGCSVGVLMLGAYLLEAVLYTPVAVLLGVGLNTWAPALVLAAVGAPLYGWMIWRAGVRMATGWTWWRQPELLAAVTPDAARR